MLIWQPTKLGGENRAKKINSHGKLAKVMTQPEYTWKYHNKSKYSYDEY